LTADVRHAALSDPVDADVYVSRAQVVRDNTWLLLKTNRAAAAILMELQQRVKSIHPDIALTDAPHDGVCTRRGASDMVAPSWGW